MRKETDTPKDFFFTHAEEIREIFGHAVRQALRRHKRLGNPIASWRDGKVVIIPPEEIPVSEDADEVSTKEVQ
jgi:hypothetical protein